MTEQEQSSSDGEDLIQLTAWEKIKFLLSNSDYALLMTSLTGIYYLISGLTFWTKFYLIHTLTVEELTASYIVSISILTSVVIGILAGGVITSVLGGIETVAAKKFLIIVATLCVPIVIPIPFVNDVMTFGILIWLLLFVGALMMPSLYVLMMSALQPNQRVQGNSFA
jgi:hypothetical protein